MQHIRSLEEINLSGAWATIGSFDGVHLGHQAIIKRLVESAHKAYSPAVVVTFYPHPVVVLRGLLDPFYLTSPEEKADLLGSLGVDYVLTLPFSLGLAALTAEEFMAMLVKSLNLKKLWVGYDFALGRNRQGDVAALQSIGLKMGYSVEIIQPVLSEGLAISSSQIRSLIREGKMDEAARRLGRYYSVSGKVIHGDGRGHLIGIPTANIDVPQERLLPANGIYATWTWVKEERHPSASNIGFRPTFDNRPPSPMVEPHILDFHQDLYGQTIKLEFVAYLRPEERYNSMEALLDQIHLDILKTREILSHAA